MAFYSRLYVKVGLCTLVLLSSSPSAMASLTGLTGSTLDPSGNIDFTISPPGGGTPGTVKLTTDGSVTTSGNVVAAGTLQPGTASLNAQCSPEGAMAYDTGNHEPVYCNQNDVWTAMNGGAFGGVFLIAGQGTPNLGYPAGADYAGQEQAPSWSWVQANTWLATCQTTNPFTGDCSCPSWASNGTVLQALSPSACNDAGSLCGTYAGFVEIYCHNP